MDSKQLYNFSWDLIRSYTEYDSGSQLVKHLLDSYNDFVLRKMEQIIDGFNPIEITNTYLPDFECFKYMLTIEIKSPVISKPTIFEKDGSTKTMTPNDARLRNFTYAGALTVDVFVESKTFDENQQKYTIDTKKFQNVSLGKMPIMVGSKYCILTSHEVSSECKYDLGGYFIVNGNEKVVVCQDRIAENKTYAFLNNKVSSYSHVAEIRSVSDVRFSVPKTTSLKLSAKPTQFGRFIRVGVHHFKHDIPLFVLFRALGIESDREILSFIVHDEEDPYMETIYKEVIGSIEEGSCCSCQRDALEYMMRYLNISGHPKELYGNKTYKLQVLNNVLQKEFLPHVGPEFDKKALYLGYMTSKLIKSYLGLQPFDDRDSYINKRVDTPGVLMANLFRQYFGKVIKDMRNMIQKEINNGSWKAKNKFIHVINKVNIAKMVKSTIIESGMKYGLATGNWGIKTNKTKQGVAQVLNRMTYNATLSHLRRINTPIEKSGKLVQPRKLHGTQWGIICPSETPEGASVGLVKNIAIMTGITINSPSNMVRNEVEKCGLKKFQNANVSIFKSSVKVFINGDIVGSHDDPSYLFHHLKKLKRLGVLNIYTSIAWNVVLNELYICTEGGRCVRPLYIVDDNKLTFDTEFIKKFDKKNTSWNECVVGEENGVPIIEFLDVDEGNDSMIAMTYKDLLKGPKGGQSTINYTHLEIHPSLILGVLAGSIPFSDHNQAPRNTYQSAMGKQAIGVYSLNYQQRFDTLGHVLNYPQKPIVYTNISKLVNTDKLPCGNNVIVAIATYTGFNQEDSIIMNKSAIDRGMFVSTYYRTFKEQNNKNHSTGEEEYFCKPDKYTKNLKPYNYDKLDKSGFVPENTFVESGDVIIGKCMPNKNENNIVNKDTSVVLKNNEIGFIDKNGSNDTWFTNTNGDGYNFCKVRLRSDRHPTIGDKFCLPPSTQVLTQYGWVNIDQVDKNRHQVLQLDPITNTSFYGPVLNTVGFRHTGKMFEAKGDTVDIQCTMEHKLFINMEDKNDFELVEAHHLETVGKQFCFKKNTTSFRPSVVGVTPPTHLVELFDNNTRSLAMTVGAFMGYGTLGQDGRTMVFNCPPMYNKLLFRLLVVHHISCECDNMSLKVLNSVLFNMFSTMLESGVPQYIRDLNNRDILALVQYMFCDKKNLTVPYKWVDAVQHMIVCCGMSSDVKRGSSDDVVGIELYTHEPREFGFEKRIVDYDGYVYCIEVPTHIFYIRENGKTMWTGNSSRHGQKGTVGMIYRQEDMPFTSEGITPDIIINPHAIPSRMTIAQLMECIMGKACCTLGSYGDATPFTDVQVDDIASVLQKNGYEQYGNEVMYNSRTGEQMPTTIFIGPTYYQRLKHMVSDKIHSRAANGPVVMLTRQPAEGRARDGGLRLGEMEIECNWAHGTMQFLKERFMECSDNFRVHVCRKCSMIATVNPDKNIYQCKPCKNITSFAEIRIPYACKLLFQEIQTMSIGTKFIV